MISKKDVSDTAKELSAIATSGHIEPDMVATTMLCEHLNIIACRLDGIADSLERIADKLCSGE